MLVVNSRTLQAPGLQYGSAKNTSVMNGGWNLAGQKFVDQRAIKNWTWITFEGQSVDAVQQTVKAFVAEVFKYGVAFDPPTAIGGKPRAIPQGALDNLFGGLNQLGVKYLLLIIPAKETGIYNKIKSLGDVKFGIHTVCCVASKFMKQDQRTGGPDLQYFANIATKFNMKAGGTNHLLRADALPPIISGGKTMLVSFLCPII